jgi:hypothetical protein
LNPWSITNETAKVASATVREAVRARSPVGSAFSRNIGRRYKIAAPKRGKKTM